MHALGLTVTGAEPGMGLVPGTAPGGRATEIGPSTAEAIDDAWRGAPRERIHEQRHPDGHVLLAVDRSPELGFRLAAPGFGTQALSADGRRLALAAPAGAAPWRPLLLLFGRALPVAATLQGLESLHASAVVIDGHVVALAAASGTGKSSLATHLVAQGAGFFTDDVLAVERSGGGVLAHPGPRLAKVAPHEYDAVPPASRARLGRPFGEEDGERLLEARGAVAPGPLEALYVLRREGAEPVAIRPVAPDPRLLLAMSYVFDVETPERRETQLAVCEALAAAVPVFDVTLPAAGAAATGAADVARHVREALA
jgi:hypothetical protein